MIEILKQNQLLLLFVVSALGYLVGSIRIAGTRLGVAAVLFVGLGFGAMDPGLQVPKIVIFLGLTIFVYTIGLSSGPGFFATFQRRGAKDIIFVLAMLLLSAVATVGLHYVFQFHASMSAGMFAGVTTNTPALAGLLDLIQHSNGSTDLGDAAKNAVVGYSLSYPMGVLGVMLAIYAAQRWLRIDYRAEEEKLRKDYAIDTQLLSRTLLVSNKEYDGRELRYVYQDCDRSVLFARIQRGDEIRLSHWDTRLRLNDKIVIVGSLEAVEKATQLLGTRVDADISYDNTDYESTKLFVSNSAVVGQSIASLNLQQHFPALITRVQRGDMELLASSDTILELGDRIQLIARSGDLEDITKLFGNSYESLSHINLLSFGSGMALGLLFGMVTFQLPGGISFSLGFAGGPMVVALVLGQLRRTGPIVWTLPYSANLTLRQFGLILLLAGIGIRSGHTFLATLQAGGGGVLFLCAAFLSFFTAFITLVIGYRFLHIPFSFLTGMVANQPAILDYAIEQSDNKLPTIGFTMILPVSMIAKILFVQVLFVALH